MVDKLKFALALLFVGAGVAGFYLLSEQVLVVRVLAVLAGVVAGAALAWFTAPGKRFAVFGRETVVETKKVVWPTRKETVQMTGIVFVFVIAMAFFLWLTDKGLEWVLYDLVLGW